MFFMNLSNVNFQPGWARAPGMIKETFDFKLGTGFMLTVPNTSPSIPIAANSSLPNQDLFSMQRKRDDSVTTRSPQRHRERHRDRNRDSHRSRRVTFVFFESKTIIFSTSAKASVVPRNHNTQSFSHRPKRNFSRVHIHKNL